MRLKPFHFAGLILTVSALLLGIAWWALFEPQVVLPEMTVQEKKQRFRAIVAPAISEVYLDLMRQYQDVSGLVQSGDNAKELSSLRGLI